MFRILLGVSWGRDSMEAIASPMVPTLVADQDWSPESTMVAVFVDRSNPKTPIFRFYEKFLASRFPHYSLLQYTKSTCKRVDSGGRPTKSKYRPVAKLVHENQS